MKWEMVHYTWERDLHITVSDKFPYPVGNITLTYSTKHLVASDAKKILMDTKWHRYMLDIYIYICVRMETPILFFSNLIDLI